MTDTIGESIPAIGISLNFQVDKSRQLVLQSSIDRDCDRETLGALLDKLFIAADRKVAKYEIDALQEEIEFHEKSLRVLQEDLDRVDVKNKQYYDQFANSNRRGPVELPAQQKQERDNVLLTKKRYEDELNIRKIKLEKLRAKL